MSASQPLSPMTPNLIPELPLPDVEPLVIEDETPVDNFLSAKLQRLLVEVLYTSWAQMGMTRPFLADADIGIFSSVNHPPIVPDVFVSLDVEAPQDFHEKRNRTYFVWELGKPPDVVIEIVSNKQGNELGRKLDDYARLGVSYYVVFDPLLQLGQKNLRTFGLHEGQYVELMRPWLEHIGLGLTLWQGRFEDLDTLWLRWCDADGHLLPTGREQAEQERLRADKAESKVSRMAERLRQLGIDPDAF